MFLIGVLLWRQHIGGEGCHHGDITVEKMGVTMDTVQWGRGVLSCTQYNGGAECYHGVSTLGERSVTMETVVGEGVLPWRQYSEGEGCYHEDSTVLWERGVTMETTQWGRE